MNILVKLLGLNPEEYNQWEISWAQEEMGAIAAALALLVPLALWFFWTSLSRIKSGLKKAVLFSLRVTIFLLLLLLLLQPELALQKSHTLKNSIAVLLDNSKSLSIQTFPDEKPRIDLVRQVLEREQDHFKKLRENYNLDFYFASDRIVPVPPDNVSKAYRPTGVFTDFGAVFSELHDRYQGKSLQGVMFFSDGGDLTQESANMSQSLLKTLSQFTGPIHTFQTGSNQMFKDLAIESLDAPDFGFAHQPVNLTVTVVASAMGNKKVPLVLKEGENVIVSKIVEISEEESHVQVDLEFTPRKLGQRIYTLSLPLFAGESITSNNRKDFQVKVVRDRIRVLHLNGRPSWDARFLREVLVNNPKVDLLSFFILRSLADDVAAPTTELSLIPFPSNLLFSDYLNSFDLVIFQNFKYSPFIDKKHLSNIKSYVENGGAFLMVGGELSFQGGGYERTGIEDILPVTFNRSSHSFASEEFRVRTAGKLSHHPILRLEKDLNINQKTWQSLPRLNGANTGLLVKPWGQALANFSLKDGKVQPALVVGKKGKGRTALLATDSSWSWNFLKVGEGGSGRYYQKFWNNVIAWLSADPDTRVLQIETDKEKYREGEQVLIKVKVLNEDYSPAIKEKVSLKLTTPLGSVETHALETGATGEKEFQFNPREEGFYRVVAQVKRGKQNITEAVSFGVFTETAEFQKPRVNPGLLKKISKISGGDYTVLNSQTRLGAHSFPNPEVLVKAKSRIFSLWNNWWSYGLLVGFLFADWWVRRKSGLS